MFTSFRIQNFRGFRDLTIDGLERVNLIAGGNNVGKTALLEAILLHLGPTNPALGRRLDQLRGIKNGKEVSAKETWGTLFHDYNIDVTVEISSVDAFGVQRALEISLVEPDTRMFTGPEEDAERLVAAMTSRIPDRQIVFNYRDSRQQQTSSSAFVTDVIHFDQIGKIAKPPPVAKFLPHSSPLPSAELFSDLEAVGREAEAVQFLKLLDPRLKRLAVLVTGGTASIHCDIGGSRLMPLELMGTGMVRLLSIILAIATTENGVVLIDEIENGLHYSVMQKVWAAIGLAARQYNVQVFATTHSWECIVAAHRAFSAAEQYDFRLHRLDRVDEDIEAVTLDQEMLGTAVRAGLEVR